MSQWPEQPVHKIIEWLHVHSPSLTVADFGCGESYWIGSAMITFLWEHQMHWPLAKCLDLFELLLTLILLFPGDARVAKSVKNKVFSFDLVSNDPDVIAGDMSNVWIFSY